MMSEQGLLYIHKVQSTRIPLAIYEFYQIPTCPVRTSTNILPKYAPKVRMLKNSLFYRFSKIYNNLPDHLKILIVSKFKKQIKEYMKYNFQPYSFPNSNYQSDSDSE